MWYIWSWYVKLASKIVSSLHFSHCSLNSFRPPLSFTLSNAITSWLVCLCLIFLPSATFSQFILIIWMIIPSRFIFSRFSYPVFPEIPRHLRIILPPFHSVPIWLSYSYLNFTWYVWWLSCILYPFLSHLPLSSKTHKAKNYISQILGVKEASSIRCNHSKIRRWKWRRSHSPLWLFSMGKESCADIGVSAFQYTVSSFLGGVGHNSFLICFLTSGFQSRMFFKSIGPLDLSITTS